MKLLEYELYWNSRYIHFIIYGFHKFIPTNLWQEIYPYYKFEKINSHERLKGLIQGMVWYVSFYCITIILIRRHLGLDYIICKHFNEVPHEGWIMQDGIENFPSITDLNDLRLSHPSKWIYSHISRVQGQVPIVLSAEKEIDSFMRWLKRNGDIGVYRVLFHQAADGVFRDFGRSFLGGYCAPLGDQSVYCAEIFAVILAIDLAWVGELCGEM